MTFVYIVITFAGIALFISIVDFILKKYKSHLKTEHQKFIEDKYTDWAVGNTMVFDIYDTCGCKEDSFVGMVKKTMARPKEREIDYLDALNANYPGEEMVVILYDIVNNKNYVVFCKGDFKESRHPYTEIKDEEEIHVREHFKYNVNTLRFVEFI